MTNNRLLMLLAGAALCCGPALAQGQPVPAVTGTSVPSTEAAPRAGRPPRLRSQLGAYLEVDQTVSADLDSGGDVLTYTTLAAGVDGRIVTRRVTAQAGYRYERRIGWNADVPDEELHSGLAGIAAEVVPGAVNLEAGAIATRTGGQGRAVGVSDRDPAINVYGIYAGPTVSTQAGNLAVSGSYRVGYVKVDDDLAPGAPGRSGDFDSTSHSVNASVGEAPGRLPVGWTAGGGYVRSESGDFDDRLEAAYVRADVVAPVSPTVAVTAGVGYEDIEASQQDFARNAAGVPVITPGGDLVADPAAPRLLTYDVTGFIYDAGVIWRPGARTELQARVGRRYGGTTVIGSASHQFRSGYGVSAAVFDSVETFGSALTSSLSNLPDTFDIAPDPISGSLTGGCITGSNPGNGVCLNPALQSVQGGSFRQRGGNILFSGTRGRWDIGTGVSYSHRRYFRPAIPGITLVQPGEDQDLTWYGTLGRDLSRTASVNLTANASWYSSDLAALDDVFSTSLAGSYRQSFLFDRLQFLAAVGLYHNNSGTFDSTVAAGQAGLRYTF